MSAPPDKGVCFKAYDNSWLYSGNRYGCPGKDLEDHLITTFRDRCPPELNDVQYAIRRKEEIDLWLSKNSNFKILITGKMGTGKSTLIKGLAEDYEIEPDHLLPHTDRVTSYTHKQDNSKFTIFDTPGLKSKAQGENDYSYLKDMVENSQEPDLLIFAIRMDEVFRRGDMAAISNISDAFG